MKIDRNKLKECTSEVPPDNKTLIEEIKAASARSHHDLVTFLKTVKIWTVGKCELYHWIEVLDIFNAVLEKACSPVTVQSVDPNDPSHESSHESQWVRQCDLPTYDQKELLICVLQVTALLIEHSFSRHLYSSMEHLTTCLAASDMSIVLAVLNLLYVFAKRSNYSTRLPNDKKQRLLGRLTHLAESWGGKENGFGLAQCCQDLSLDLFPPSATTLHFEFYAETSTDPQTTNSSKDGSTATPPLPAPSAKTSKPSASALQCIHMESVDKSEPKLPSQLMDELVHQYAVPKEKLDLLFTHLRLAYCFAKTQTRIQCVQARLQALSILVYSNSLVDKSNTILYNGLIEELVDILKLKTTTVSWVGGVNDGMNVPQVVTEVKAAALRTLTSIFFIMDDYPKMLLIIDATGASSYHGFLPVLVRSCIQAMLDHHMAASGFPQTYATALFSFLYSLASYAGDDVGRKALVACGMMESLLKVINHHCEDQDHITFVTRAVRVIDLMTNLDELRDIPSPTAFISRLEHEVNICRKHTGSDTGSDTGSGFTRGRLGRLGSTGAGRESLSDIEPPAPRPGVQCLPQRAELLKSMLTFLKKAFPDPSFPDSIRHVTDGDLPRSLKHIISNAEYYGPSLVLLATDVINGYILVLLATDVVNGNFFQDLASLFECPICFNYVLPPILQCQSGHIVCSQCRPKLQCCPTCRGPLGNIRNLAMEKVASPLRLLYASRSCSNLDVRELMTYCGRGDVGGVRRLLLTFGAAEVVGAKSLRGWTGLHCAAWKGHVDVAALLLEHKADPDAKDNRGWTGLHYAAREGHVDVAALLIEHKADPDAKANSGRTPMDIAKQEGKDEVVKLIEDAKKRQFNSSGAMPTTPPSSDADDSR